MQWRWQGLTYPKSPLFATPLHQAAEVAPRVTKNVACPFDASSPFSACHNRALSNARKKSVPALPHCIPMRFQRNTPATFSTSTESGTTPASNRFTEQTSPSHNRSEALYIDDISFPRLVLRYRVTRRTRQEGEGQSLVQSSNIRDR